MTTDELLKVVHPSTEVVVAQNVNSCFGEETIYKRVGLDHGKLIYNKTELQNMLVKSLSVDNDELKILIDEIPLTSDRSFPPTPFDSK